MRPWELSSAAAHGACPPTPTKMNAWGMVGWGAGPHFPLLSGPVRWFPTLSYCGPSADHTGQELSPSSPWMGPLGPAPLRGGGKWAGSRCLQVDLGCPAAPARPILSSTN